MNGGRACLKELRHGQMREAMSRPPGGISADELRQMAFHAAHSPRVRSIDITEIDAAADSADGRTVRLGALLVLEAACGLACR